MLELLIGLFCCAVLAGTYTYSGYKNRLWLGLSALLMVYPVLLIDGIYTSWGWLYCTSYLWLSLSEWEFLFSILIMLLTILRYNKIVRLPRIILFGLLLGCLLRHEWPVSICIWLICSGYYMIKKDYKQYSIFYNEKIAFNSTAFCLASFILMNYFYIWNKIMLTLI